MRTYFDYNATAPLEPAVLEAMLPYLREQHGNASSRHEEGRQAWAGVEQARAQVAAAVNARPEEIVFTSSGTESNNAIIRGVAEAAPRTRRRIVVSAIEHPCVLCAARAAANRDNGEMIPIGCDRNGLLAMAELEQAVADGSACVVSVMLANNETGTLQDIVSVSAVAKAAGAVMHSDSAQALGKIPIDFATLGVDAMTLSGHKAGGPMGVAALVVRSEVEWLPLLEGGGHEHGRRSGTLNVAGIVGFGVAAELAAERSVAYGARIAPLRDQLEVRLRAVGVQVYGAGAPRLPNTSYVGFPGIDGEALVVMLDQAGFAVASGAACASFKDDASHVLQAMGYNSEQARCAIRVSLGPASTAEQVEGFAQVVQALGVRLRALSSVNAG